MFICDKNEIGLRLKHLREKAGLSQDAVAKEVGLSRELVSKWENGERDPNIQAIATLSELYHSTCDYIITGIETENVALSRETGLSQKAIDTIMRIADRLRLRQAMFGEDSLTVLSVLLECDCIEEIDMLYSLYRYTRYAMEVISDKDKWRNEYLKQVFKNKFHQILVDDGYYDELGEVIIRGSYEQYFRAMMEMIEKVLKKE